ncbi:MAG TPA: acetyl-CoA carboxylase biotin carboxyl carrier protein subunit [Anaerolineales bacterium]|nr:acetyl-CoA carboxylase biotin carboxyl carrier protein subunit [Anaerolineales bacterium]
MNINVKVEDKTYEVIIENVNSNPMIARIGDETFEVRFGPEEAGLLPPATAAIQPRLNGLQTNAKESVITSPIPGVVSKIYILEGQTLDTGEPLMVIEAMKMNNTIRANRSGVVKKIFAEKGSFVKHHQPLLEFTD